MQSLQEETSEGKQGALPSEAPLLGETEYADENALLPLLQREARLRRGDDISLLLWAFAVLAGILRLISVTPAMLQVGFGCMALISTALFIHLGLRAHRRRRTLAAALAKNGCAPQVSPLIQALRVNDVVVTDVAKRALIDILPTLRASDSAFIGPSERAILLRHLAVSPNDPGPRHLTELFSPTALRREIALRVSILKLMEQVGGSQELSLVETLANAQATPRGKFEVPEEIRLAAKECLPFLQSRVSEQIASEQLLRPSGAHGTPAAQLLRPASAGLEARPEELLRSSDIA